MNDCPTVKVKSSEPDHDGYFTINESDFDAAKHELFEPPAAAPLPLPPPPPPPVVVDPLAEMVGDWQSFEPARLKQVAAAVSGRAVENKAQAVQVIQAALAAK